MTTAGLRVGHAERNRSFLHQVRKHYHPYLFISPFFILFAVFGLFPYGYAFLLSFLRWDGIGPQEWVGLANYQTLVTDELWWKSVVNSVWLLVLTTANLPIAFGLAFLINRKTTRFRHIFRVAYFMPIVAAPVAVTTIFMGLLGDRYGTLNYALSLVHIPGVDWLGEALWIKPSIALVVIWSWFGWNVIIYLAGLQSISTELYEAAICDGANTWQMFRWVTVPLMWPIINFTLILSVIGALQLFDIPMVLTSRSGALGSGGPDNAGLTPMMYLYSSGFQYLKFGYSAAISVGLFLAIVVFSVIYYRTIGRRGGFD